MFMHRPQNLAFVLVALAACARGAVRLTPENSAMSYRWHGTLASPSDLSGVVQVTGTVWMGPGDKRGTTDVSVTMANVAPGGIHPWAVHVGDCAHDQGVFGSADAYEPLKVGSDGKAAATVTVPLEAPTTGSYFVIIHASAQNMLTTLACGNMAPPAQ